MSAACSGVAAAVYCLDSASRRRRQQEEAERKRREAKALEAFVQRRILPPTQEESRAFEEMLKRSANSAQARKRCGRP